MQTPFDINRITWIHHQDFGRETFLWFIYLDTTMGNSFLTLNESTDAEIIWQSFLAIPSVHRFERGRHSFAYNFAKIEQAVVSGTLGAFVFSGRPSHEYRSVTLQPLHREALDLALPAYRRWLHAQCPPEQPDHIYCSLTVTLVAEQTKQGPTRLESEFPRISLFQETLCTRSYHWVFPLDTWLDEAQQMLLGIYEHIIRIPGTESGAELPEDQDRSQFDAWLPTREENFDLDSPIVGNARGMSLLVRPVLGA